MRIRKTDEIRKWSIIIVDNIAIGIDEQENNKILKAIDLNKISNRAEFRYNESTKKFDLTNSKIMDNIIKDKILSIVKRNSEILVEAFKND